MATGATFQNIFFPFDPKTAERNSTNFPNIGVDLRRKLYQTPK